MLELLSEGLSFDGVQYTIELSAIICNDPARQFVKSIKRQCGYGAFERCTKKVVHIEEHRSRIFPFLENVVLRTDDSFLKQTQKKSSHRRKPT
jgi:hypothetical protein